MADPLDRLFGPSGRTIREEILTWPEERKVEFEIVRARCTACHTLDPVFAARVPAGNWALVVAKMARRPGAAIPDVEQPAIAGFLEYFADQRAKHQARQE